MTTLSRRQLGLLAVGGLLAPKANAVTVPGAPEPLLLHWAGFALRGSAESAESAFPHSWALMKQKSASGVPLLNEELKRRVDTASIPNATLTLGLGNTKKGDSIGLAFALTWENVSVERIGSDFKTTVDLRADALVFDFESMKVIAAIPVASQLRDVSAVAPTQEKIGGLVRRLYFGSDANIFGGFVNTLSKTQLKRSYGAYAQVAPALLEDKAAASLNEWRAEPRRVAELTAGALEAFIYTQLGTPLVPHTTGHAIGGAMTARFANGDVFNLKLPTPDYVIQPTIRGFKKVELGSTAAETAYAYAVFSTITVTQELRASPYLSGTFKFAVTKTVPASARDLSDWSAFQESVLAFLDAFSRQLKQPDPAWIAKWAESGTREQFEAAATALARCK